MVQQLPKSGAKAAPRLKAGHPPAGAHGGRTHSGFRLSTPPSEESHETALKAGGKRVAKKGFEENPTHTTPEKDAKKSDKISKSLATPNRMQQVGILLTGTLDKLSHDFPETPVSVRHCKVRPAVEKTHSPRIFFIQQPRKY